MKKLLIALLSTCMILSGCTSEKKIDYKSALSDLTEKYASDSKVQDTVKSFIETALAKAKEKADIEDVAFMTTDDFDTIQAFAKEHSSEITYASIGIGAIVVTGSICVLVFKTACIVSVLALICNYVEAGDEDDLEVCQFDDILDNFKDSESSDDLKTSLEDGKVIVLKGFADIIEKVNNQ